MLNIPSKPELRSTLSRENTQLANPIKTLVLALAIFMAGLYPAVYGYYYEPGSIVRVLDILVYLPAVTVGIGILLITSKPKFGRSPAIIVLAFYALLSLTWTNASNFLLAAYQMFIFLSVIPISALIEDKKTEHLIIKITLLATTFVCLSNWYYAFQYEIIYRANFRLGTFTAPQYFSNPNSVASLFGLAVLFIVDILLKPSSRRMWKPIYYRLIFPCLLLVLLVSLLFTGSRGGLIATIGALLVKVYVLFPRQRLKLVISSLVIASIFAVVGAPLFNSVPVYQRSVDLFSESADLSYLKRLTLYRIALDTASDDPIRLLIGGGGGSANDIVTGEIKDNSEYSHLFFGPSYYRTNRYTTQVLYTHSMFIDWYFSFGLIGIILLIFLLITIYHRIRKFGSKESLLEKVSVLVYFMMTGIFTVSYNQSFWLIMGSLFLYWCSNSDKKLPLPFDVTSNHWN